MLKVFVCSIALLLGLHVYSQPRLSSKFNQRNNRSANHEVTYSLRVRDLTEFKLNYGDDITIQHAYPAAGVIVLRCSKIVFQKFIDDTNIIFIDVIRKPVAEGNDDAINHAFNRVTKSHHLFPGITGHDLNISIKEQHFDSADIDLINRNFETEVSPTEIATHATDMAVIIAGGGNSSIKGKGIACEAQITSSDFENLLPDEDHIFLDNEIYLQNHSYGVDIENYYGNEALAYDEQVSANPQIMHVFSAGNQGQLMPGDGTYKDMHYANLTGNFKQAKNILVVTAVDTTLSINERNSKGPAFDGRLKPELAAYGNGGTSDAAALVTGVAALIQQAYKSVHNEMPDAAMVKAILIASADDVGKEGIDYTHGYGSVNAYKALKLVDQQNTFLFEMESEATHRVSIDVPENTDELKVAITWTDPPAESEDSPTLVHDINAQLNYNENSYLPWVLNDFAHVDSLEKKAVRHADHLNNVEYITIKYPESGSYELQVTAPEDLLTTTQLVAVAYWLNEKSVFTWDYPSAADVMEADKKHTLFWESPMDHNGDLFVQLNDGAWQPVDQNIDMNSYYHWNAPDTTAITRLKMSIEGTDYVSDTFLISRKTQVKVAYHCDEDFSLTWNAIAGVDHYEVFSLGEKYLEKIATTEDTVLLLSKDAEHLYFSVAPGIVEHTGIKSLTFDYTEQGSLCYINFFTAGRFEDQRVTLQLVLSTLLNIDEIIIHKTLNGKESVLITMTPESSLTLVAYDTVFSSGVIQYQAEVILHNGSRVVSDISEVFIAATGQALLFPNPVADDALSILSEGETFTIKISDSMGRILLIKELEYVLEILDVNNLLPGMYLFQLEHAGKVIDTGRFIRL